MLQFNSVKEIGADIKGMCADAAEVIWNGKNGNLHLKGWAYPNITTSGERQQSVSIILL